MVEKTPFKYIVMLPKYVLHTEEVMCVVDSH